jgi:hypothetical protein
MLGDGSLMNERMMMPDMPNSAKAPELSRMVFGRPEAGEESILRRAFKPKSSYTYSSEKVETQLLTIIGSVGSLDRKELDSRLDSLFWLKPICGFPAMFKLHGSFGGFRQFWDNCWRPAYDFGPALGSDSAYEA